MAAQAEALALKIQNETQYPLRLVTDEFEVEIGFETRKSAYAGRVALEGLQTEYNAVTELAEAVDGQMRAPIPLTFDGNDLYGPDGRSLTKTAENGLVAAREQAKDNGNLWFEVGRRSHERDEVKQTIEMIKRGRANTMFIITDFPSALEGTAEDVGGYNHIRRQALARAIMTLPNGEIWLISQTLDKSDRQALEAIQADLGSKTEKGEMLSQRRELNLTHEEQSNLMDRVTAVYDKKLAQNFGGEWYAGRRPNDYRNTYDFICQQADLIDVYKNLKLSGNLTSNNMYDLIATANARFEAKKEYKATGAGFSATSPQTVTYSINYDPNLVYQEIKMHGNSARSQGKTFSACGSTYKADDAKETSLESSGYGKIEGETKTWHGGKIYKNSKCVSCEKVKHEVGACRICKECVNSPKKHSVSGSKTAKKPVTYAIAGQNSNRKKPLKSKASSATAKNSISYIVK